MADLLRLTSIGAFEAAKTAREEARNRLEGHLYRLTGLLKHESYNRALQDYATEPERNALSKLLGETFEWLTEHADRADETILRSKRSDLETLEAPVVSRFSEKRTRGKAVEDFQQAMFAARAFFIEAHKNNTAALEAAENASTEETVDPPKYTEEELKTVQDILKENEVWMDEKMAVQVKSEDELAKDPVILTSDLNERGKKLQMTVGMDGSCDSGSLIELGRW